MPLYYESSFLYYKASLEQSRILSSAVQFQAVIPASGAEQYKSSARPAAKLQSVTLKDWPTKYFI